MSPESTEHYNLKKIFEDKLRSWYGASIDEYYDRGHILDVYAITSSGLKIYVEIVWSNFKNDMLILERSEADIKVVIANPSILKNKNLVKDFNKTVMSQRGRGVKIWGVMINGERILSEPTCIDSEIRQIFDALISEISDDDDQHILERALAAYSDSSIKIWSSLVSELGPDEKPDRYSHGIWHISYSILGDYDKPNFKQLLEILKKVEDHKSGWPPWVIPSTYGIRPYKSGDSIECWIKSARIKDGAFSDFWRVSTDVHLFLLRGYYEDSQIAASARSAVLFPQSMGITPGTFLDPIQPVRRMGECLLHAGRLATELNASGPIYFKAVWKGLKNRKLFSMTPPFPFFREETSHECAVSSDITEPVERISTHLPEIVKELTNPLFNSFDFFDLSLEIIKREISELRA